MASADHEQTQLLSITKAPPKRAPQAGSATSPVHGRVPHPQEEGEL